MSNYDGSSTTLKNFLLIATIGATSTLSIPVAYQETYIPHQNVAIADYNLVQNDSRNWADNYDSYEYKNTDTIKMNAIIEFSKNICENCIDIESDFVEIVNANFWDLV